MTVINPDHYKHPTGIECIQITEHMNFCLGNAVKYIWRAGQKGDRLTDLRKAQWYINREIENDTSKMADAHDRQSESHGAEQGDRGAGVPQGERLGEAGHPPREDQRSDQAPERTVTVGQRTYTHIAPRLVECSTPGAAPFTLELSSPYGGHQLLNDLER